MCQLDTIRKCLTPAMVYAELKRMPESLDQIYNRILQAVPKLHRPFVQSALRWLAFANQPLVVEELAEAVALRLDDTSFDVERSRLFNKTKILELCGSLVTTTRKEFKQNCMLPERKLVEADLDRDYPTRWVRDGSVFKVDVVSLSHFSVKEYILSPRHCDGGLADFHTSERLAHAFLARSCLFYLLHFNSGEVATTLEFDEWPLLSYSAKNWILHWQRAHPDCSGQPEARELAELLFDPLSGSAYVNWLNVTFPESALDGYSRVLRTTPQQFPQTLYWAAHLGDLGLVEWLLGRGADAAMKELKSSAAKFESALGTAAYHGHSDVVDCLLRHGANPNLRSSEYGTVLQIAAVGGSMRVTQQLLNAGAEVNTPGGAYNSALVAAASKEHYDVVSLLVRHGADINAGSREHGSSLYQAALAGDAKMVVALLAVGADINLMSDADGTALYAAAQKGLVPIVQLLLRRGADVNRGGRGEFGYPISAAAEQGHVQVVRLLIRAGANVNVLGGTRGVTALEAAVESRHVPTFRTILDAGADPNVEGTVSHATPVSSHS